MLPVPGFGHTYVNAEQVDGEARCAALLGSDRMMVDRQTREYCGDAVDVDQAAPDDMDHDAHHDH